MTRTQLLLPLATAMIALSGCGQLHGAAGQSSGAAPTPTPAMSPLLPSLTEQEVEQGWHVHLQSPSPTESATAVSEDTARRALLAAEPNLSPDGSPTVIRSDALVDSWDNRSAITPSSPHAFVWVFDVSRPGWLPMTGACNRASCPPITGDALTLGIVDAVSGKFLAVDSTDYMPSSATSTPIS